MTKKELKFWAAIMALNIIVFLPWYLFSYTESDFLPLEGLMEGGIYDRFKYLFNRDNYDLFRLSFDLVLICILIYLFRFSHRLSHVVKFALTYYLIIVIYQIYSAFFNLIYQAPEIIYNDFPLLKNGVKIVIENFSWLNVLSLGGFLALVFIVTKLFTYLARSLVNIRMGYFSKAIIALILLFIFTGLIRYRIKTKPSLAVQFVAASIWNNVKRSLELKETVEKIDYDDFYELNDQYDFRFDKNRPNIIIVFIESYGRVLLDHKDLYLSYQKTMLEKQSKLALKDFFGMSALSTAPVTGGGSWLSYTTFSVGYRLHLQSLFFNFLKNKEFLKYRHLYKWLKHQGYKNYRLNSQYDENKFSIPWNQYTSFYAVDEWVRFKNLDYQGILYGFGPSPPDQYALNYTLELIRNKEQDPFSLFFITKNSHTPFLLPHTTMKDWSAWNELRGENQPYRFFQKPTLDNYEKAINYQLDYIFQIINNSSQNDLFIVIGDHQPPALATEGFETPVHIISKDSAFIKGFENYGLTSGLLPDKTKTPLKHEGLYSMLLRELKRNYSSDSVSLPDYLPNGIIFGGDQDTK
ncbi:hypothetical protein QQ020_08200 [Fulvivirgaceae bacterium BMA12]|uniref:Sulfatase N-terminal domain-containing protein n=1 Tax=Agaribacillus aureus TaxID=3051825 RepID=A0ABT8L2R5_9BACT|nr:hypothetical protein [Fulvivirgaceae bacterium BMA12]